MTTSVSTANRKIPIVKKIDVGLIEERDFPLFEIGAQLAGASVVVVRGLFDDGETWQEALQVESEVELGGGLAPPVLRPIDAVGNQRNG